MVGDGGEGFYCYVRNWGQHTVVQVGMETWQAKQVDQD